MTMAGWRFPSFCLRGFTQESKRDHISLLSLECGNAVPLQDSICDDMVVSLIAHDYKR
jgi:hypothetical protein